MRNIYKIQKIWCVIFIIILFGGCSSEQENNVEESNIVEIPVMFRMDPHTYEASNLELVEQFNEAYEGKYKVVVAWVVDTEIGYRRKIKQLNAVDKLPAVITDVGFDGCFLELLIKNNRLTNLAEYMENDKEWKNAYKKDIWDAIHEEDGAVYVSPLGNMMYSSTGIIYNRELLKSAGYMAIPDNWVDFLNCLKKLQEIGITPLSLHGGGEYWVPMLFASSYVYQTPEGRNFLETKNPLTYQTLPMEQMMQFLKQLYTYSYEDALDIEYNDAEKRFYEGEAAIIANGPWMFMGLSQEERELYGFSVFPEGQLLGAWEMTSWVVVDTYPQEVIEGAIEFMKFRTLKDQKDVEKDIENAKQSANFDIMDTYLKLAWGTEKFIPNYQINWDSSVVNECMVTYIPQFVLNEISLEMLLQKMEEADQKTMR